MANHSFFDQPAYYQIRVLGQVQSRWSDFFDGMTIQLTQDEAGRQVSVLTGMLADQAALQGVLQKLYNLGCPLLLAERIEPRPPPCR